MAAGAALLYLSRDRGERAPATPAASAPRRVRPPAPRRPRREPATAPDPEPAEARRPAAKKAVEPAPAPADAAPRADAATLVVESDVPGASVFLDREFVGTAPVTLKDLAPGAKRHQPVGRRLRRHLRTVELSPGEQTVAMRFRKSASTPPSGVAHKHGVGGGCEGTLRATVDGLAYETSNKGDAFSLRYDQVEAFEVNYLEKNLRVKQRGGKTWNFTDRQADNADRLFVFHRDVQAARDKLAKGYTAAR